MLAEAVFAFYLLYREGLTEGRGRMLTALAGILLAFGLRGWMFGYETLDYQNFLRPWVTFYRENGGFSALRESVGNYNIPYLYFMALFSYSSLRDLTLIKLLSCFFDVLLARGVMGLVGHCGGGKNKKLAVFLATLLLPTVVLNGALWGQCDSIYVALSVLAVYEVLEERPVFSMVLFALSFGFKLQAVFILPAAVVLWAAKKLRWYHFLIFPATYVVLVLPAVLLGRPFWDTVTLYLSQTGSVGSGLNYNSPSLFAFFPFEDKTGAMAHSGIAAAFTLMGAVLLSAAVFRRKLNDRAVLAAVLLLAVGIPFLLPHMHERYFFAADVFSLVLAFVLPRFALTAPLVQFASLLGYHAYLKGRYLLPMSYGATALGAVLVLTLLAYARELSGGELRKMDP